jgi:hypothetical protein
MESRKRHRPASPPRRPVRITGAVRVDLTSDSSSWASLARLIGCTPPGGHAILEVGDLSVTYVEVIDIRVPHLIAEVLVTRGIDLEVTGLPSAVRSWMLRLRELTGTPGGPPSSRGRRLQIVGGGAA